MCWVYVWSTSVMLAQFSSNLFLVYVCFCKPSLSVYLSVNSLCFIIGKKVWYLQGSPNWKWTEQIPANMRRWPNVGLLLARRLRRWPNSKPTLGRRLMFAEIAINDTDSILDSEFFRKNEAFVKSELLSQLKCVSHDNLSYWRMPPYGKYDPYAGIRWQTLGLC